MYIIGEKLVPLKHGKFDKLSISTLVNEYIVFHYEGKKLVMRNNPVWPQKQLVFGKTRLLDL